MSLERNITVTDPVDHNLSAEHMCVLASRRSRSIDPTSVILEEVKEKGPANMLQNYYLNYGKSGKKGSLPGHGSICQSGSMTVELENVSILAAVAFEDHQLFNGQECSTRYIDMSKRNYFVPEIKSSTELPMQPEAIINEWFNLYDLVYKDVYEQLKATEVKPGDVKERVFDKALRAAALDKASGFLPTATKTNLSWHTQLDNANTQVQMLKSYPLKEVRDTASDVQSALMDRYKNSIKEELPEGHREYYDKYSGYIFYSEISTQLSMSTESHVLVSEAAEHQMSWSLDKAASNETYDSKLIISQNAEEMMMNAPRYMYLPPMLKNMGYVQTHGILDFASFRDLHRHRDGNIPVPYLSAKHGIYSWYIKGLSPMVQYQVNEKVEKLLAAVTEIARKSPYEAQYLLPMSIRVPVEMNMNLPQFKYIAELRSGHACREPIRLFAKLMATKLKTAFPNMALYACMDEEQPYFMERGKQDIHRVNDNGDIVSLSTGEVEGNVNDNPEI